MLKLIAIKSSEQREWICDAPSRRRDVDQRWGKKPQWEDHRDLAYYLDRDSPRSRSFETRNKKRSRTVNSDRSRGSNGRKRNLMFIVPPLSHSLIWKHFHGQRVRNHLEPHVANNDTRSFLRKFSRGPSGTQVCACVHPRVPVLCIHEMLGAYAYSSLPFAHRHWRRMVGHNAETNRVPRRIYICIHECAWDAKK